MARGPASRDEGTLNIRGLFADAKRILILGHHNADPDAVGSMYAFARAIEKINPSTKIILACDDVSRLSNQVLQTFSPDIDIEENVTGSFDLTVLLDTNSKTQIGSQFQEYTEDPSKVFVIDHHEENPDLNDLAINHVIRSDCSSTCEIVSDIYDELELEIDSTSANLLLTGIMFDTRRFFYANEKTLGTAIRLLDFDADYEECVQSLIIRPDRSERIARLKAASRMKVHTISKWVIATATINAFEASSCRGMLGLGADVAIVAGKPSKNVVRFSARSTKEFYEKTGVNLGTDIMEQVGEVIGGKGGGHPNAAGANGVQNRTKGLKKSVELIRSAITQAETKDD